MKAWVAKGGGSNLYKKNLVIIESIGWVAQGGGGWGTFGSMRRGRFFHHKIHIKHQDLAQKDGRYNMVMLITREMDE